MPKRQPAQQQPHFTIEVQPRAIATELAALPDDTEVSYSSNVAGWSTTSRTSAKALRAQIEAIIERQRQDHYTLTEAAQILTDAGRVGDPESHLVQLQRAWADGSLPVHQGGSRYLRRPDEVICTHDDTVTVADLDDWLLKHQKTEQGFPVDAAAGAEGSHRRVVHSTKAKRRDDLAPVIEEAQRKCIDPKDAPAVWRQLVHMAQAKTSPFFGVTEEVALQWMSSSGKVRYLTKAALRKRLKRSIKDAKGR